MKAGLYAYSCKVCGMGWRAYGTQGYRFVCDSCRSAARSAFTVQTWERDGWAPTPVVS